MSMGTALGWLAEPSQGCQGGHSFAGMWFPITWQGAGHIHSAGAQTPAPSARWIFRKRGCLAGCVYRWVEELQEADNIFFSSICAASDPFI